MVSSFENRGSNCLFVLLINNSEVQPTHNGRKFGAHVDREQQNRPRDLGGRRAGCDQGQPQMNIIALVIITEIIFAASYRFAFDDPLGETRRGKAGLCGLYFSQFLGLCIIVLTIVRIYLWLRSRA